MELKHIWRANNFVLPWDFGKRFLEEKYPSTDNLSRQIEFQFCWSQWWQYDMGETIPQVDGRRARDSAESSSNLHCSEALTA